MYTSNTFKTVVALSGFVGFMVLIGPGWLRDDLAETARLSGTRLQVAA